MSRKAYSTTTILTTTGVAMIFLAVVTFILACLTFTPPTQAAIPKEDKCVRWTNRITATVPHAGPIIPFAVKASLGVMRFHKPVYIDVLVCD